jgi:hypothetical protein
MAIERVTITNWELWGRLIKTWATGANCFQGTPHENEPVPPRPQNLRELDEQCKKFGVGMRIPERVKGVQFIQANQETLLVRLPDAGMVLDSEAAIKADPNSYPLPVFYGPTFTTPPNGEPFYADGLKLTADNCMVFHACRIGDYTIAQCG